MSSGSRLAWAVLGCGFGPTVIRPSRVPNHEAVGRSPGNRLTGASLPCGRSGVSEIVAWKSGTTPDQPGAEALGVAGTGRFEDVEFSDEIVLVGLAWFYPDACRGGCRQHSPGSAEPAPVCGSSRSNPSNIRVE